MDLKLNYQGLYYYKPQEENLFVHKKLSKMNEVEQNKKNKKLHKKLKKINFVHSFYNTKLF